MSRPPTLAGLPAADVGLAVGLLVIAEVSVLTANDPANPRPLDASLALLLTLPLAARRIRPVIAAAVVGGALLTQSLIAEPLEALWVIFSVTIMSFSVAAAAPLAPAVVAAALMCVALSVSIVNDRSDEAANIPPTLVLFVAVPFAAGMALRRREQRALAVEAEGHQRARDAVVAERYRIARELHDVVAHSISVIAVQADAADAALRGAPDRAREPVAVIRRTAVEALGEMERLLGILREAGGREEVSPPRGIADLDALLDDTRALGFSVSFAQTGRSRPVSSGVDLCVYRVVQEGLTNARKHAAGSHVDVRIGFLDAALDVEVRDDGPGGGPGGGSGLGLVGLRERVELFGGTLMAGRADEGWRLAATLPLVDRNGDGA